MSEEEESFIKTLNELKEAQQRFTDRLNELSAAQQKVTDQIESVQEADRHHFGFGWRLRHAQEAVVNAQQQVSPDLHLKEDQQKIRDELSKAQSHLAKTEQESMKTRQEVTKSEIAFSDVLFNFQYALSQFKPDFKDVSSILESLSTTLQPLWDEIYLEAPPLADQLQYFCNMVRVFYDAAKEYSFAVHDYIAAMQTHRNARLILGSVKFDERFARNRTSAGESERLKSAKLRESKALEGLGDAWRSIAAAQKDILEAKRKYFESQRLLFKVNSAMSSQLPKVTEALPFLPEIIEHVPPALHHFTIALGLLWNALDKASEILNSIYGVTLGP